jgi:hypothetical protein
LSNDSNHLGQIKRDADATSLRTAGEEFGCLLRAVRKLPGYERYLLPRPFTALLQVANTVSVFLSGEFNSHFLVVTPGCQEPLIINAKGLSKKRLESIADSLSRCIKASRRITTDLSLATEQSGRPVDYHHVLSTLWNEAMSLVVNQLGWTVRTLPNYASASCF